MSTTSETAGRSKRTRRAKELLQRSARIRAAGGRAARSGVPRAEHGRWSPAPDRPDPVALLEEQAVSRLPELVPIRYGRMLLSPLSFYRGAALIMAADLAATLRSGLDVQLCGDAHLSNFGLFASPERRLMFDINDFDETLPGPWEWDVKRLAASFEVLGRQRGFSRDDRRTIVGAGVREYRERIRKAATMGVLESWYAGLDVDGLLDRVRTDERRGRVTKQERKTAERRVAQAHARDSTQVFAKRASEAGGELRIVADPPLVVPLENLAISDPAWGQNAERLINRLLRSYRRTLAHQHHPIEQFRYVHAARKVVGVGSVGTRAYILLLLSNDGDEPLFLQVKEAQESVLERFVGPSELSHHGQRVVFGQRLMQAASDIFLGWQRIKGLDGQTRDYYVRQFKDWKGGAEVERMQVSGAALYARLCGATLARAHARSGDRIAIAAYLGKGTGFEDAVASFAAVYAEQNERDYETFVEAVRSGRIEAETGV